MLSNNPMTKDQTRRLIEGCFADLKGPADHGFVPQTTRPEIEVAEQKELSRDFIERRLQQIESQSYSPDVRIRAMVVAQQAGFTFGDQPASVQHDLMEGVARAEIEQVRLQLFRLDDRLSSYAALDPLFALTTTDPTTPPGPVGFETPSSGMTLGQLVEAYLASGTGEWASKTVASKTRQLRLLTDFLGQDTPLAVISTDKVRTYRDTLKTLRAKKYSAPGLTFLQKRTLDTTKQIAPDVPLSFHPAATRVLGLVTPRSVG